GQAAEHRAAMHRQRLEVEHLRARLAQRAEEPALAAARRSVHDDEFRLARNGGQLVDDPAPVRAIAAFERARIPADLAQDVRHRAGALAAAPAIDEWPPSLIVLPERHFYMTRDVLRDQRGAELLRLERRHLLVERAHL